MSSRIWPKAVPLLVLTGVLIYANCVNKTFVFDDDAWLVDNASLDNPRAYLESIQGRPLLGLTNLAMHRLGQNNPVPHHVLNIFIHLGATLTLYGLVRRTLLRPRFRGRFLGQAPYLAFATALLFLVHPLQVQCVTYVIQRGESMAGLFYLLILYAMLRGEEVDRNTSRAAYRRWGWYSLAISSLVLGYLSKEIMASAPGAVILFDRIFLSKSWRHMLHRRWLFYVLFFIVWGGFTVWHLYRADKTEGGIGFGMEEITPKKYALTEAGAILYYLKLCVWPRGMSIDYQSWPWRSTPEEAMPELAIVAGLLLLTTLLVFWKPALGFVCAWFFIVLAPSSSVLPIIDAVFEHRMYLSVASVALLGVLLGDGLLRATGFKKLRPFVLAAVAIAFGVLTILRNEEYRSRAVVWKIALERMPNSVRAHTNYGQGLLLEDRYEEAIPVLTRAVELSPYDATALTNLAFAHESLGNYQVEVECYKRIQEAYPKEWKHWNTYADVLLALGRWQKAASIYERASELKPDAVESRYGRAAALFALGRDNEAEIVAGAATRIDPNWPDTVLEMARSVILDERKRSSPIARRSALNWAKLGMQYSPKPTARQRDTLGLCYAAQSEFLMAGAQSLSALEANPDPVWESIHRERLRLYHLHLTPWPTSP